MCIVTKVIQSHIFDDKTTRSSQPETPKDHIRLLYRNVIHGHTRRLRQHAMGVLFCDGMLQKYWLFRKQKDVPGWYRNIIPITQISTIITLNQFFWGKNWGSNSWTFRFGCQMVPKDCQFTFFLGSFFGTPWKVLVAVGSLKNDGSKISLSYWV